MEIKTKQQKLADKNQKKLENDRKILARLVELCKDYTVGDASIIVAQEFNISVPTLYKIRQRNK